MLLLGLEREFRGSCLPPGDASAFAITDAAWLAFFAKLAFSKDMFLESFTAIMYDIMLFSLISDREEVILDLVRLISSQGATRRATHDLVEHDSLDIQGLQVCGE